MAVFFMRGVRGDFAVVLFVVLKVWGQFAGFTPVRASERFFLYETS